MRFCARFLALRSLGPVQKYNAPSSQTPSSAVTWGRPSGRPVDSQYTSAPSRPPRACSHSVGTAPGLLNAHSSVTGSCSTIVSPSPVLSSRLPGGENPSRTDRRSNHTQNRRSSFHRASGQAGSDSSMPPASPGPGHPATPSTGHTGPAATRAAHAGTTSAPDSPAMPRSAWSAGEWRLPYQAATLPELCRKGLGYPITIIWGVHHVDACQDSYVRCGQADL
jgi:hypothetical protein